MGNFNAALIWNNKAQQLPYYKDLREDLQFASELMELIIHFELKNFQLLEYKTIAFYKRFYLLVSFASWQFYFEPTRLS